MKYTVTGPVCQFGIGQKLKLTPIQIDTRKHALDILDADKGRVAVSSLVQFKKGEEIDLALKEDELPSSLAAVLSPSVKVPKAEKPSKATKGAAAPDEIDLDALETELDEAESTLRSAHAKHGLSMDLDLTDDQRALVASEIDRYTKAKAAFDAAIGDD